MTNTNVRALDTRPRSPGGGRRWRLATLSICAASSLALAACGEDGDRAANEETSNPDVSTPHSSSATAEGDGPTTGGSLTFLRTGPVPLNWDPTDSSSDGVTDPGGTGSYLEAVFGVLAYEDYGSGKVVPSMAESISTQDGTTWTLTLHDGMTFSDGSPYDAEAVKFNWQRHLDPELASNHAGVVEGIASMTAVDETTLEITLVDPNAQFDRSIARYLPFVGSPTAIENDLDGFRTNPVGAGPFTLADYGADQKATFARNPDYWDAPRPYLDELVIATIADDEQRYNAFTTGQGQLMTVFQGRSHVAEAEEAGYQVFKLVAGGGSGVMINHARPPFDDPMAREILTRILDVESKTATIDFGVNVPLQTIFPESSPYHDGSLTLPRFDADEAQRLLDEYAERTGGPLTFSLLMYDGTRELGEFYQAQVQSFENLDVGIELVAANEYVPTLAQGNFDVANFPFNFGDPVDQFATYLTTSGQLNFGGYDNPEMDRLVAEATAADTLAERVEIFKDIQRIVIDDVAYVFTQENAEVQLAIQDVKDLQYAIDGVPLWDRVWLAG